MKNFKKFVSYILILIIFMGVFQKSVFANEQLPATIANDFINTTLPGSSNYSLQFHIQRPPAPAPIQSPPIAAGWNFVGNLDSWNSHRATNYHVYRSIATAAARTWQRVSPAPTITTADNAIINHVNSNTAPGTGPMINGNFYSFLIRPSHIHPPGYFAIAPGNPPVGSAGHTPLPPWAIGEQLAPIAGNQEFYFMTDLQVSGQGRGNTMMIRWQRPILNGSDPFTHYDIRFASGIGNSPMPVGANLQSIEIPNNIQNLPALTGNEMPPNGLYLDGNYYVFVFTNQTITSGSVFSVLVEPRIGNITRHSNPSLSNHFESDKNLLLAYTMNDFRTNNVFIIPNFSFTPIGLNLLELRWQAPSGIESILIERESPYGSGNWTTLGNLPTYFGASNINYWIIERPFEKTGFRITFITPPSVPNIPPEYIYFDPEVFPWTPTTPDIIYVSHQPSPIATPPITMDITWQAFFRNPLTPEEAAPSNPNLRNVFGVGNRYFDQDIYYEIWITNELLDAESTDEPVSQSFAGEMVERIRASDLDLIFVNAQGVEVAQNTEGGRWAYSMQFSEFFDRASEDLIPFVANNLYYIMIVARRAESSGEASNPALFAHFIPGNAIARPPFVPTPPLSVLEYSTSIRVSWNMRWFEALVDGEWILAAIRGNNLILGNDVTISDLNATLNEFETPGAFFTRFGDYPIRMQVIPPNSNFQFHIAPLSSIPTDDNDFEEFMYNLQNNNTAWQTMQGIVATGESRYFDITNLAPSTAFGIFFRPINSEGSTWWPSFISATTLPDRPDYEITPTVPTIEPVTAWDTILRIRIREYAAPALRYEFRISETLLTSQQAITSALNPNSNHHQTNTANNIIFGYYDILNLFPETTYYIWARSVSPGGDMSNWSNPIVMTTLPLIAPNPPIGLGPASLLNINIINSENEVNFAPVESNAMAVEWFPQPREITLPTFNLPLDGITTVNPQAQILGSELINNYIVRFTALVANRPYYIRARTILTATRENAESAAQLEYNYIIQIATNPDFIDATTIYVMPDASEMTANANRRVAMSDWTRTLIFRTGQSDSEHDGSINPDLIPIPSRDFEIIYIPSTQTLIYRFRSNLVDSYGNRDNLVDQRFISRLIQNRIFDYQIDLTNYNNLPVQNRIVELPFSIINAFEERGINFSIISGQTIYTLTSGFASDISDFSIGSNLRIYINNSQTGIGNPGLNMNPIQSFEMTVSDSNIRNRYNPIQNISQPLIISHKISPADFIDMNIGAYRRQSPSSGWERMNSNINNIENTLQTQTNRIGMQFAAFGVLAPNIQAQNPQIQSAIYSIQPIIRIDGLNSQNINSTITTQMANSIIYAIANNHHFVDINSNLSNIQISRLNSSGMLINSISDINLSLERLASIRNGFRISNLNFNISTLGEFLVAIENIL